MSPLVSAIRAFLAWRRAKRVAPLAEARASRADMIRTHRTKRDHRPLHDLYRRQRSDTTRQLRMEIGR